MQNLQQVNTHTSSKNERTGNKSAVNDYDRLHPSKDKGLVQRFSSILAGLSSRLVCAVDQSNSKNTFSRLQKHAEVAVQNRQQAIDLQKEEQEKAERKRRDFAHKQELEQVKHQSHQQFLDDNLFALQENQDDQEDQNALKKDALRPSDILAAAIVASQQQSDNQSGDTITDTNSGNGVIANVDINTTTNSTLSASSSFGGEPSFDEVATFASLSAADANLLSGLGEKVTSASASGSVAVFSGSSGSALGMQTLQEQDAQKAQDLSAKTNEIVNAETDPQEQNQNQGQGSGSGSNSLVNGFGRDEASSAAQAAAQMLQIDGVESDENIHRSLQQLQRQQSAVVMPEQHTPSASEQLAGMDGKELKKNLDALARENNVSKLSLKMANPEMLSMQKRDAQMLSQLPTTKTDSLAAITGSGDISRLQQVSYVENSGSSLNSLVSVSGSDSSIEQVASIGNRQMGVNGRTSTEILMQQQQLRQESHGLVEHVALTAAARAQQEAQQLESQNVTAEQMAVRAAHHAAHGMPTGGVDASVFGVGIDAGLAMQAQSGASGSSSAVNGVQAVPQSLVSEVAAMDAGMATLTSGSGAFLANNASGNSMATGNEAMAVTNNATAQEANSSATNANSVGSASALALLRLALEQDKLTTQAMSGEEVDELYEEAGDKTNALSDINKLPATKSKTSGLAQALQSLQQGVRVPNAGVGYEQSVFANVMTSNALTEADLAAAVESDENAMTSAVQAALGSGKAFDANSATATMGANNAQVRDALMQNEAQVQALVQNQMEAQIQEREQLQREFANMNLGMDPTSDAAMLHERVMQMAARNMKHLAVDLNPRDLGKMRIAIELSDDNDALSVTLAAASPETRALLAETLPILENTLEQQNVTTNAQILDLNEIELEENAQKAVALSVAAVRTMSDPRRGVGEKQSVV